ncbi:hypothetical protein QZM81_21280 [Burkholderia cepacia]|uniref:hypothetical protein n=1 Tax=Burkholderia cepacia TaxID=292 RepID=UPI0026568F46|nr:hypothetical protein [Burkholderia cepacia]MDN7858334.1 hypothetical protein [Burkholderia cepacia]
MNTPLQTQLGNQQVPQNPHAEVIYYYGLFMVAWSVADTVIQAATMKKLGTGAEDAVRDTAGKTFHPRVERLRKLLEQEGDTHKEAIELLQNFQKMAHRNTLAHGNIIVGVPGQFTFINYGKSGLEKQTFTTEDFKKHVNDLNNRTAELQRLLQVTDADLQQICDATLGLAAEV